MCIVDQDHTCMLAPSRSLAHLLELNVAYLTLPCLPFGFPGDGLAAGCRCPHQSSEKPLQAVQADFKPRNRGFATCTTHRLSMRTPWNAVHTVKQTVDKQARPRFNPANLPKPSTLPRRPLPPNVFRPPIGQKQIHLCAVLFFV